MSEEQSQWWRSSPEVLRALKRNNSHENRRDEVTRQFPPVGLHVRDKKESWHESI